MPCFVLILYFVNFAAYCDSCLYVTCESVCARVCVPVCVYARVCVCARVRACMYACLCECAWQFTQMIVYLDEASGD